MADYSVLLSVYYKEKAEYLRNSIQSIFNQTIPTNDFVVICDGELTIELNNVLADMQQLFGNRLHVIQLDNNVGLGNALNEGLKYCKNELVARMDSDDISRPNRCEKQLQLFDSHPNLDIISGTVEEFSKSIENVETSRVLPETNEEIIEFAKKRNPFNHPCVMYKKTAVETAGGYQELYLLEDYFLWIRMLANGSQGYNIQEPLLWMRGGRELYKRRSGLKYARSQKKLFRYMSDIGFITKEQFLKNSSLRICSSLAPNRLREMMFKRYVRR